MGHRGLQGDTGEYKRLHGFSRKKLNSDSLDFLCSGLQGVTGGYKGLQGFSISVFSVNSDLLKFVSSGNDLRNNLLSNHADDT